MVSESQSANVVTLLLKATLSASPLSNLGEPTFQSERDHSITPILSSQTFFASVFVPHLKSADVRTVSWKETPIQTSYLSCWRQIRSRPLLRKPPNQLSFGFESRTGLCDLVLLLWTASSCSAKQLFIMQN